MSGVSVATMISSSAADVPVRVQIAVALGEMESPGWRDRMLAGVITPKQIAQFTAAELAP
jgi:hypothetical protein